MLENVFPALLGYLSAEKDFVAGWEQLRHWPDGAIDVLVTAGLLKPENTATVIECMGCFEHCLMPVTVQHGKAFVMCGDPNFGRVKIPQECLQQWQISRAGLAKWFAGKLRIKEKPELDKVTGDYKIGNFKAGKRVGLLVLGFADGVVLKAGGHVLPLIEVLEVTTGRLGVDQLAVANLVDLPVVVEKKPRYQPSEIKREHGKLKTAERNKKWRAEYLKLKKANPDKSDTWISQKIAKMDIADGKDSETIRRNMVR